MVSKCTQTTQSLKVTSVKVRSTDGDVVSRLKVKSIRVHSYMIRCVATDCFSGLTVDYSSELSKEVKRMVKGSTCGQTVKSTTVTSKVMIVMESVLSTTQMESALKGSGKMAKSTERVSTYGQTALSIS